MAIINRDNYQSWKYTQRINMRQYPRTPEEAFIAPAPESLRRSALVPQEAIPNPEFEETPTTSQASRSALDIWYEEHMRRNPTIVSTTPDNNLIMGHGGDADDLDPEPVSTDQVVAAPQESQPQVHWFTSNSYPSNKPERKQDMFEIKDKNGNMMVKLNDEGEFVCAHTAIATEASKRFIKSLKREGKSYAEMIEELNMLRKENERKDRLIKELEADNKHLENKLKNGNENITVAPRAVRENDGGERKTGYVTFVNPDDVNW